MDRAPAPSFLSARDKLALFRSIALLGFALLDQKKNKDTNTHTTVYLYVLPTCARH